MELNTYLNFYFTFVFFLGIICFGFMTIQSWIIVIRQTYLTNKSETDVFPELSNNWREKSYENELLLIYCNRELIYSNVNEMVQYPWFYLLKQINKLYLFVHTLFWTYRHSSPISPMSDEMLMWMFFTKFSRHWALKLIHSCTTKIFIT